MCRSAHNRKTVAVPGGSAGASDRDPSRSSSTSPTAVAQNDGLVALAAVFLLLAMGFSALGSNPWSFNPGTVRADGTLGWVVRLAGSRWDVGLLQAGIVVALAWVSAVGVVVARGWRPRPALLLALVMLACACAVLPAVVLQVALREGTAPWFYTNDSTYQIEMAGDLANDGHTPYNHDYRSSGLARFYTGRGTLPDRVDRIVALRHFPYFPGMAGLSGVWRSCRHRRTTSGGRSPSPRSCSSPRRCSTPGRMAFALRSALRSPATRWPCGWPGSATPTPSACWRWWSRLAWPCAATPGRPAPRWRWPS